MKAYTIRDIERALRDAGAVLVRTRGSHKIWRLPNGERFQTKDKAKNGKSQRGNMKALAKLLSHGQAGVGKSA